MVVYIVMITNDEYGIIQQQVDSIWKTWEGASERVKYLNGLYQKSNDKHLHAYYREEPVK